jgi:acyl-CoA thioester hydrolase
MQPSFVSASPWSRWAKPLVRPSLADYPCTSLEKLRFADTDLNGHISHAVFAVCCQNARMELLNARAGLSLPARTHFAIARLELDFLGELRWPAEIAIGTRIDRIGPRSLTVNQGLFAGGVCVGKAASIVVLVDAVTRRALPLPAAITGALAHLRVHPPVDPDSVFRPLLQRLGRFGRWG